MPEKTVQQFIPKQPLQQEPMGRRAPLFFVFSVFGAVAVLILWAGAFTYLQIQQKALKRVQVDLSKLEGEFDAKTIQELQLVSVSLSSLQKLLASHVYSSSAFTFLERNTLNAIQFTSFNFSVKDYTVKLAGEGVNFSAASEQLRVFQGHSLVRSVSFKNLSLTDDGNIRFNALIEFKPELFNQQANL